MAEGISYQNKDIEFKILSEYYQEKSFRAYGLDLPKVKKVLPTNLPRISADEKRIDNLFLLEDGTIAIVDYESEDKLSNRIKYMNYIARVMERYYRDNQKIINLRLIIIYTGDIEKADSEFKLECMTLKMEQVFLSRLDGDGIFSHIKHKLMNGSPLTDEEIMQLIILPLTKKGREEKHIMLEQVIQLTQTMTEEEQQAFIIAGILVASDKFINANYSWKIRRWLGMTKIGRLIADEARLEEKKEAAEKMLADGLSIVQIMKYTGLSKEQIGTIEDEIKQN